MLSGLFTYVATISLPWRLANACHLYSTRDAEPSAGFDFYGRQTDNIWFNVPWGEVAPQPFRVIVAMTPAVKPQ